MKTKHTDTKVLKGTKSSPGKAEVKKKVLREVCFTGTTFLLSISYVQEPNVHFVHEVGKLSVGDFYPMQ